MSKKFFVTFSFDDGYKEVIDRVLPLLDEYNIKASFNIITGLVGKRFEGKEIANWDDLKELDRKSHEICSHSVSHAMLNPSLKVQMERLWCGLRYSSDRLQLLKRTISFYRKIKTQRPININQFKEEAKKSKEVLEDAFGIKCFSFVYPHGSYTEQAKFIVKECGYTSARSSKIGFNDPLNFDRFCLKIQQWDASVSLRDANKWVDRAMKASLWLIECLHLVTKCRLDDPFWSSLQDLNRHLEYLTGKEGYFVGTQRDIVSMLWKNRDEVSGAY